MSDTGPKDLKRSIRDKYKRRLIWLAHAIKQLEYAANDRLENGGNIRDREEVEELLLALESIKHLLPQEDEGLTEEMNRKLCELFDIEYVPLDKDA